MKSATLSRLVAELRAFRETFASRLVVLQADAAVQEALVFEALDGTEVPARMLMKGRGGTDFRPAFDWVRQHAPEAVVLYATDGYGTFPKTPPANAVLWLLTAGHLAPGKVPFGAVAEVE